MPLIVRRTLDGRDAQLGVPGSLQLIPPGFKVPCWQLCIEVGACLLDADEGGAHLNFDHGIGPRIELRESSNGISGHFCAIRYRQNALIDALGVERSAEARDKIALEA